MTEEATLVRCETDESIFLAPICDGLHGIPKRCIAHWGKQIWITDGLDAMLVDIDECAVTKKVTLQEELSANEFAYGALLAQASWVDGPGRAYFLFQEYTNTGSSVPLYLIDLDDFQIMAEYRLGAVRQSCNEVDLSLRNAVAFPRGSLEPELFLFWESSLCGAFMNRWYFAAPDPLPKLSSVFINGEQHAYPLCRGDVPRIMWSGVDMTNMYMSVVHTANCEGYPDSPNMGELYVCNHAAFSFSVRDSPRDCRERD